MSGFPCVCPPLTSRPASTAWKCIHSLHRIPLPNKDLVCLRPNHTEHRLTAPQRHQRRRRNALFKVFCTSIYTQDIPLEDLLGSGGQTDFIQIAQTLICLTIHQDAGAAPPPRLVRPTPRFSLCFLLCKSPAGPSPKFVACRWPEITKCLSKAAA